MYDDYLENIGIELKFESQFDFKKQEIPGIHWPAKPLYVFP